MKRAMSSVWAMLVAAMGGLVPGVSGAAVLAASGDVRSISGGWYVGSTGSGVFETSAPFSLPARATISALEFGFSVRPGETPYYIEWRVGTGAFGVEFADFAENWSRGPASATEDFVGSWVNQYGVQFDVYDMTIDVSHRDLLLDAGDYWLTLRRAIACNSFCQTAWTGAGQGNVASTRFVNNANQVENLQSIGAQNFVIHGELGQSNAPEPSTLALVGSVLLLAVRVSSARRRRIDA